jgi:rhodanese-related sulfurtransferase
MNAKGYDPLDKVMKQSMKALTIAEWESLEKDGAWILDARPATVFTQGFVPGAINIGLDGRFAEWAGSILPFDQPLILITEPGKEEEAILRLARVGFDKVNGYLKGGFPAWQAAGKPVDLIIDVTADELAMDMPFDQKLEVIDVRKAAEFDAGHVKGAHLLPLNDLRDPLMMAQMDEDKNLYVHCAGGYRSAIACSLMKREGFHNLRNVLGGWSEMVKEKRIPIVKPVA